MKSTINLENTKTKSEYPCLKKLGSWELYVLFTEYNKGVCVYAGSYSAVKVGENHWWDESIFEPFNGTVTLSND